MREGAWLQRIPIHVDAAAAAIWTNMPSTAAFFLGARHHITLVDLAGMAEIRLLVDKSTIAAAAGAKLYVRYNSTFLAASADYIDIGVSEVSVAIDTTNTILDSGTIAINNDALALQETYVAIIGIGGDGVVDPTFGSVTIELK